MYFQYMTTAFINMENNTPITVNILPSDPIINNIYNYTIYDNYNEYDNEYDNILNSETKNESYSKNENVPEECKEDDQDHKDLPNLTQYYKDYMEQHDIDMVEEFDCVCCICDNALVNRQIVCSDECERQYINIKSLDNYKY